MRGQRQWHFTGLIMSNHKLIVGRRYQIRTFQQMKPEQRDWFISNGLVPGELVRVVARLFGGRYWVLCLHNQCIAMRISEIEKLSLYVQDS